MRENLSSGFAKNTGADQPAHPRSLISAFVIRLCYVYTISPATTAVTISATVDETGRP